MYTPHGGGRTGTGPTEESDSADVETVGAVEHWSCGLVGLVASVALVVLLYPVLVTVTRPLHLLSSTALVVILAGIWLATWLALELVWEWRAGRLSGDA